ncbi:MAG: ATP-dependent Clp protease ATP-binding subunit [Oscillospiraceae bacterium]|nr:ATP-dependent Clp protease ATP-binding subunit [Oscillospiraceae bacterium]
MFRFSGFTQKANNAINVAMLQAGLLGHTYIGSEHLVLGMLDENSGVAHIVLTQKKVSFESYRNAITATIGKGSKTELTPEDFTPRCKKTLEMAVIKARMMGQGQVGTEHILMVIARETDSYGVKLLREQGVEPGALIGAMMADLGPELTENTDRRRAVPPAKALPRPSLGSGSTPNLNKYSRDLTEMARAGALDPVIGRDSEVARVIQILSRRTKNNPCLIGEAGVGKTAIIEGLAQRIVCCEVPEGLRGKRVASLDLTSMVAGAKYRGDFEDRIKNVMEEAASARDVILFIDELHTIMGAGAAEGAIDAANIMKPQLARGEIQVIGATTIAEYRKFIEKDTALERRFQSVTVEQPSESDAIEILKGLRGRYEAHHKIMITDEAITAAVTLSSRFIADRLLPDKAIDLMDEAASRLRMRDYGPDLAGMESRLGELGAEKEDAILSQDFELAAAIRDREKSLRGRIGDIRTELLQSGGSGKKCLLREDISELVASITGIELASLTREQGEQLLLLEERLKARVLGQGQAVSAVAGAIRRGRAGLADPARPVGSFLFLGPTGVGKTELAKALAENLFGQKGAMIRLDMSEYMEKHAAAKLIGSPPGYIGFEEGGQLTERVRRRPYSVVLFDEVEKAHSDVWGLLLQILEDGLLTDSQGRAVSFKNTVVIMTSNIGARHITDHKQLGFGTDGTRPEGDMKRDIMAELKKTFRPELLNRLDEIIIFNRLGEENLLGIAKKLLGELCARAGENNISLEFSEATAQIIAREGIGSVYGARPLRRAVRKQIEDPLARRILSGEVQPGEHLFCDIGEDGLVIHHKEFSADRD